MRLYIMRHGETAWNAQKKIQGVADIPLDGKGKELAKITGWALRDVDFDRVITSPLNRAKETVLELWRECRCQEAIILSFRRT